MADTPHPQHAKRTFLVVIDESEELAKALLYACRRADNNNGDIALLFVLDPVEFQHWVAVGELMRAEQREAAEAKINAVAQQVKERAGREPKILIREGVPVEQVLQVIDEDKSITALVLAASSGKEGPGPLVSQLTGQLVGRVHVPMIIVPDSLSDEHILEIT
jgi:nucleotide-binding universal stress UspA family protein